MALKLIPGGGGIRTTNATALKTPAQRKAAYEAKLAESALDAGHGRKLKFEVLDSERVKALGHPAFCGFKLPYFDLDGKSTKFYRLRYLEDTRHGVLRLTGAKMMRYVQEGKTVNEVYLPPLINWRKVAEDKDIPITITEGELKAACGCAHGIVTMGLGGVWCFRSAKNNLPLLPIFSSFVWKDRNVAICYDSDAATNTMVVDAENALAKALVALGARVRIVRMPNVEGRAKTGLDDYIVSHGVENTLRMILACSTDFEFSRALHEFNAEFIYISNPGFVYCPAKNHKMYPSAFKEHHYSDRSHTEQKTDSNGNVKMVEKPTAAEWLKWKHRNKVDGMTYAPGKDTVLYDPKKMTRQVNLWEGMGATPVQGDVSMWKRLMEHLFTIYQQEERIWFERWCAYPLQHIGAKMASACAFWGGQTGTGKTLVGHTLMKLYGSNATEIKDDQLRDSRNEWAESKQFVLGDDITGHNSRELQNRFKTLITQKLMTINIKYVPSYTVPDCINYYFTSNDPDAFYLDKNDRRFFIHEVRAAKISKAFKDEFIAWRDGSDDGINALYHYFLTLDLGDFDPMGDAYVTADKAQMVNMGRSDLGQWVDDLGQGDKVTLNGVEMDCQLFTAAELLRLFDPLSEKRISAQGLARELRRAGFRPTPGQVHTKSIPGSGRSQLWILRNTSKWETAEHRDLAEHFEKHRPNGALKTTKF